MRAPAAAALLLALVASALAEPLKFHDCGKPAGVPAPRAPQSLGDGGRVPQRPRAVGWGGGRGPASLFCRFQLSADWRSLKLPASEPLAQVS